MSDCATRPSTLLFLDLAIFIPIISAIVAHYTVGATFFFIGCGSLCFALSICIPILLASIPLVLKNKLSTRLAFTCNISAVVLSIIRTGWMFYVAVTISRVVVFGLADSSQLNAERASRIIKVLEKDNKTVMMYTTESVYKQAMLSLYENDWELWNKLESKHLKYKNKKEKDEVNNVLDKVSLAVADTDKLVKKAYYLMKSYDVCKVLTKCAKGCFLYRILDDGFHSQIKTIRDIDSIKELNNN